MAIESLSYKITEAGLTVPVTYLDETGEHIQNIEHILYISTYFFHYSIFNGEIINNTG